MPDKLPDKLPDHLLHPETTSARYFVNPEFRSSPTSTHIDVIDPATQATVGQRLVCDEECIAEVVSLANVAQQDWEALDAKTRASALHRIADSIETSAATDIAILMTCEMGKPYPESIGEIANCGAVFRYYAEMARDEAGKVAGTTQAGFIHSRHFTPPLMVSRHSLQEVQSQVYDLNYS